MQAKENHGEASAAQSSGLDARFRAPLMAYFLRRVGSQSEAEDLTQEAFTRLLGSPSFAKANRSPQSEQANAYVFRVASNLLHDKARANRRWKMHSLSVNESTTTAEASNEFIEDRSPERVFIGKESLAAVLASLNEIDERSKSIFMLFRLGGMKQKDIANLYGISISTVEKAVIAASVHLAKRFRQNPP